MAIRKEFNIQGSFNAVAFCDERTFWSGALGPTVFERIAESDPNFEPIQVSISGDVTSAGLHHIKVKVHGSLTLFCERCARDFGFSFGSDSTLWVARDEDQIEAIEPLIGENDELILASEAISAVQLCEDEILLALPFSPRCEKPDCEVVKV